MSFFFFGTNRLTSISGSSLITQCNNVKPNVITFDTQVKTALFDILQPSTLAIKKINSQTKIGIYFVPPFFHFANQCQAKRENCHQMCFLHNLMAAQLTVVVGRQIDSSRLLASEILNSRNYNKKGFNSPKSSAYFDSTTNQH